MLAAGRFGGYRYPMTASKSPGGPPASGRDSRLERQAAALRANLKRRKQQARRRADDAKAAAASSAAGTSPAQKENER
jgi:hypothetical protein